MDTLLGTLNSLTDARRMIDEMAVAGGYRPTEYGEYSPTYSRQTDGVTEELTIEKHGKRQWHVKKTTSAAKP